MTFNDIKKANEAITTTAIERKDKNGQTTTKEYAEVNQRIKAFRMLYPQGYILTEMVSNENGVCLFRAQVGFYDENNNPFTLGTGTAQEKESSSYINKTSYVENCETSAVGRALGMAGIGIDTSVASYEEVANAMKNQNPEEESIRRQMIREIETLAAQARIKISALCKGVGIKDLGEMDKLHYAQLKAKLTEYITDQRAKQEAKDGDPSQA